MKLTKEESEILDDFEQGRLVPSVTDKKELKKFVDGAKKFGKKTKKIHIYLAEEDFHDIQVKAMQKGIPYQTLLNKNIEECRIVMLRDAFSEMMLAYQEQNIEIPPGK